MEIYGHTIKQAFLPSLPYRDLHLGPFPVSKQIASLISKPKNPFHLSVFFICDYPSPMPQNKL